MCWKNGKTVLSYLCTRKVTIKKEENYRAVSVLNACYRLYSKILSEKLEASGRVPFGMPE